MNDENDKLKQLLKNTPVPEPRGAARERAVQAALSAFRRQHRTEEKKIKGFSFPRRLTGKNQKGESKMKPTFPLFAKTAVAAAMLAVVVAIAIPNFISYRANKTAHTTFMNQEVRGGRVMREQMPPQTDFAAPKPMAETEGTAALSTTAAPREKTEQPRTPRPSAVPGKNPPLLAYRDFVNKKVMKRAPAQVQSMGSPSVVYDKDHFIDRDPYRQPDPADEGRDRFETITPNPVKRVAEEPVSTFSIDVDTASYAFVRRQLNQGVLPRKDAVRVEELINYFNYDYPLPADRSVPFKPTVAVYPTPWNPDTRLLHIGIKGFDLLPEQTPRSNLVFLIDVSGSMNRPDKLPLLKNALAMLVNTLNPSDRVAIVVYAGAAGTVLPPTPVRDKGKILAALDNLHAGGSTAGGAGIHLAYSLAKANFDPDGVNRVILATDGDFNVGTRDPEALKNVVERNRETGIFLSVLGFGQGNYNDALMQKLAQNGNGNAAYIDNLNEARKVLVDEAGSTLFTIAGDVKIQIEFNPERVAEYRLIGYETRLLKREDFNNDQVDAGEIGAGHSVTVIFEITPKGSAARLMDDLRYGTPQEKDPDVPRMAESEEYAFLKIRYKLPNATKSRLDTLPIGREQTYASVADAPRDVRFAAAVAAFGQLLRQNPYTKDFTYDDVIALGQSARGEDRFGYRSEFLNLVRLAKTARVMGER